MQARSFYTVARKRSRWWLSLFDFIVDICIGNAFVLDCESRGLDVLRDQLEFRCRLIDCLLSVGFTGDHPVPRKRRAPSTEEVVYAPQEIVTHLPDKADVRQRCAWCSSQKKTNLTNVKCVYCGVHLCLVKGRNCFTLYHTHGRFGAAPVPT